MCQINKIKVAKSGADVDEHGMKNTTTRGMLADFLHLGTNLTAELIWSEKMLTAAEQKAFVRAQAMTKQFAQLSLKDRFVERAA
jgi:hypothetical protein